MRRFILSDRKFSQSSTLRGNFSGRIGAQFLALTLMFAILVGAAGSAWAQTAPELRSDHPDRYVVQKGDTLWDIASRFLKDPWRWPLIWQNNPDIENPHLIFPGDLLVVTGSDNIKVVRLKPKVRRSPLDRGIPAIPPNIIQPFLTWPLIIQPGELDDAGYVLQEVDDGIVIGKYSHFYARNIKDLEADSYSLFRPGETLSHPETGELLGVETADLGSARMLRADEDVSKLVVSESFQEISPGDRIVPDRESTPLPYFEPRSPEQEVDGWILYAPRGVKEVGRFDVVIISGGEREGLEPGHVLRVMFHRAARKDPITGETFTPPDESSGLMMVFRVFEKLSYALIMEATRQINIGDRYINP
jgi:hypothetical protein